MDKNILNALNWRYAAKVFNKEKKLTEEQVKIVLEAGRLSPSSLGIEPWKFFLINDTETRKKIFEASKQPKVLDASHLIVITYKTNSENLIKERIERTAKIQSQKIEDLKDYEEYLRNSLQKKIDDDSFEEWSKAQTYIALGIMVETASLLDIDNGPMEGFDPEALEAILDLKKQNLKPATMLALGYRGEEPLALKPKIRRDYEDAIEII